MNREEIQKLFEDSFPAGIEWKEVFSKLDTMKNEDYYQDLLRYACNQVVSIITEGFVKYDFDNFEKEQKEFFGFDFVELLLENIEKLDKQSYFYWALYYFYKKEYARCKKCIGDLFQNIKKDGDVFDEVSLLDLLLVPFKQGFDGLWEYVAQEIKSLKTENSIQELCEMIAVFYEEKSENAVLDVLLGYNQKYPDIHVVNEWIGYTYYKLSMWNNALAYFEKMEDDLYFFYPADWYWWMAWSYGKTKNHAEEEKYYRKSQELNPYREFLLNNLGYSCYQQKKYNEAKEIFEKCLSEGIDVRYAANNYVRVLIAMGRNGDAKKFVKSGKYKIVKALKDRVDKLDNSNARIKNNSLALAVDVEEETVSSSVDIGIKRQQFSSEKLLEDELTARIEAGISTFGLNLKVYKCHGEYGRQYRIDDGRLDLLCEDEKGELYVIELKKDSGYDDAYKQTVGYLDWFANSEKFKEKKVHGIICLNNPSQDLIRAVKNDDRIKLYEYQISYTELA